LTFITSMASVDVRNTYYSGRPRTTDEDWAAYK